LRQKKTGAPRQNDITPHNGKQPYPHPALKFDTADAETQHGAMIQALLKQNVSRLVAALLFFLAPFCQAGVGELDKNFQSPPANTRMWVYWYFMDGMMTREGLTADLEAMHRAGIGGAIFLEVNIGLPRGPVEFMSPEWQELLTYAAHEADRLGIELALAAGPGWCGTGGPWVKPEQSMQHLVASQTNLAGPQQFSGLLPKPAPRLPYFGEGTLTPELKAEWQGFFRDVAVLAFPTPGGNARIADADEKALYYRDPFSSKAGVKPFLPAPAEFPVLPAGQCIPADAVVDLTAKLSADGRLDWIVPPGRWTVLRFGRTITGQTTRPAPVPGLGFESDKFDPAALDAQFAAFGGKVISNIGPRPHRDRGLTTLHFDSWEMGSQNWSEQFRAEFQKRRGYDPLKYFPAYLGMVVDSPEITERFLWDMRLTAGELIVANQARHLRELAHQHRLKLSIEPYDLNPAGDLELGAEADIPMGEFWADGDGFDTAYSCIEATSVGHTHGKAIIGAESFTGGGTFSWTRHPGSMKNQADWAFAMGLNRLTVHRFQHQPWTNRFPGLTMGPYGTQYERTQTWWEMSGAWHEYVARCQYLLRQGLPVADILYLTPEGAPNVFRPPSSALAGKKNMPDRKGYNFDGIDAPTLMRDIKVRHGKLILPDGMSYRALVLPRMETMTPQLLKKIRDLVKAGATVIGEPPQKSPSLMNYPQCDADVKQIARQIWGNTTGPGTNVNFDSLYPDYASVSNRLDLMNIPPDFSSSQPLRFNHRQLKQADLYFVSNPSDSSQNAACTFRIAGKQPELWNPITGRTRLLPDWQPAAPGLTTIPLRFGPHESYFIVFRQNARPPAGQNAGNNFPETQTCLQIDGPWELAFQPGRGAPASLVLDHLGSWSTQTNPGVKYFSGEAVYARHFRLDPALAAEGRPLFLDLGRVEVMARVTVNGHIFDTLWCAPWRVDISPAIKAVDNALQIKVVNLWPNRMIGDAHQPSDTPRNGPTAAAWPRWLLDGKPSPAGRITWASFEPFRADSPLLPSGLLGPVTLQTGEK
jgi:hypothetical protein